MIKVEATLPVRAAQHSKAMESVVMMGVAFKVVLLSDIS